MTTHLSLEPLNYAFSLHTTSWYVYVKVYTRKQMDSAAACMAYMNIT